jgi:hypothetical protein
MATFEERVYELGANALAEQERQVSELRGRGATLLAAAAVIASLLAKPVFHNGHPRGLEEVVPSGLGLLGAAGVLVFVVLLLRRTRSASVSKQVPPTAPYGTKALPASH